VRRRLALLAVIALVFPLSAAHAQHYSFVVTGDGRSSSPARPGMDEHGINTTIMKELVAEILRIQPKFVLFSGDLVHGYTTEQEFHSQLDAWLQIMKPVYAAGIHVYPVRGNHDVTSTNAEHVWNEVFSGPYALPDNGPDGEKNITFAATEENALILGVDEYGLHPHTVNLGWLHEQLAHNTRPLVFVLGHEMAFRSGHHADTLDNKPALRDQFIAALGNAGARVYFAGHDHFYDRQEITDPAHHPGLDIEQLVVGTAGAPFYQGRDYAGDNGSWHVTHVKHVELTYGYMLGKVDGTRVSLYFMGRIAPGVYEALDAFSYTAGAEAQPVPSARR
jgi:hypothetical protein